MLLFFIQIQEGETEYGIGWFSWWLCENCGDDDESMDKEQMKEPAKPWELIKTNMAKINHNGGWGN